MSLLADHPTAEAVLAAMPCYPVPFQGQSPALEALRAARAGQGLAVGHNGVMLVLRRPWLQLDALVTSPMAIYLPYGSVGRPRADLRCGRIPRAHFEKIMDHFRGALPNEAAAFVFWNESTFAFLVEFPAIDEATPSRLVYRTPTLPSEWHMVCDIHSHGHGPAYFSATDDLDDALATKISIVIGRIERPCGPEVASRLCANGMFMPLPRSPFSGELHANGLL